MPATKKTPRSAANAAGAVSIERFHSAAQQDFGAGAIDGALQVALTALISARCFLMRGDLPSAIIAASEASRAAVAAVDSMSAWMG